MTDGRQITEEEAIHAAEYVLGLTGAAERRAFEAEMASFPALQDEVMGWDEDLIALSEAIDPVQPGPHVQAGLERRLFGEVTEARAGLFSSLGFWRGLGLAGVAASAALAVLLFTGLPQPTAPVAPPAATLYTAQVAAEDGALQLAALYDPALGVLTVNRVAGQAAEGRALELWLIAGQDAPVSLGVLPADPRGRLQVPDALAVKFEGGVLAISDEPPGGSPTGAPTGAVLAVGPAVAL